MAAAQGLEFRGSSPGEGVEAARRVILCHVAHLDIGAPLFLDHNRGKELVQSCEILDEVARVIGSLE